jgi:hypothetical protein
LSYRDWSIVRVTGVGTITIDPGDASTAFTAYRDGSTRCADQTRGVEVEGFARADNGDLVMVTITMCDNGPAGSGADEFHILIPEGGPYEKAGSLSLGDVAKIAGSPPSPAFSRATGLGAIGPGAPTLGSDRQDFDFDVNSVETGRLFYRDYSVVRNGGAGQLVVDAADAATGFAAFHQTTSNCVRITGTGRIDTGDLLRFYVDACDNASPGTGFDRFTLTVPDRMGRGVPYVRSGALSSGDVALGNGAAATPGSVSVTTTTTGSSVDPDGYTVRLDGGSSRAIAVNGSVTYTNVAAGSHTIVLSGVAANCSVEGGTTRTVTVPDGGSASVTFGVSCTSQATGLAFTVQPSDTRAGEDIKPAVHVTVVDAQGNRVTSFTGDVTVAIGRNGGLLMPGTLSGVTTVTAVSGIATFFDLTIDQIGNGYTLRATAPGLTGAESQPFNVGP